MNTETTTATTKTIDRVWLVLLGATLLTFAVAETGMAGAGFPAMLFIFALACGKSALVILHFMELRRAPFLWRLVLFGWLTVVTLGILAAWWSGHQAA